MVQTLSVPLIVQKNPGKPPETILSVAAYQAVGRVESVRAHADPPVSPGELGLHLIDRLHLSITPAVEVGPIIVIRYEEKLACRGPFRLYDCLVHAAGDEGRFSQTAVFIKRGRP